MAITFGTDGVRGRAFDEVGLADAFLIGRAAAQVLGGTHAVIGRDTRESGPALTAAIAAGLAAGGVTPLDLAVAPTPAVAFVANERNALGVVISASHNPWHDNGIKLFSRSGAKLSDEEQAAIEAILADDSEPAPTEMPAVTAASIQSEVGGWVSSVVTTLNGLDLSGLKVVLDCANGAASHVVAPALADAGVDLTVLFNTPDGRNINDGCGSTHPEALAAAVLEQRADIGLALDGDHIMAMLALDMRDRGTLAQNRLVVTVMSNLGLLRAMERAGVEVEITPVGDRNVLIAISELGANFGGEQSGHLIFADHALTGDGTLSGVQVLSLLKRSGRSLQDLASSAMTSFPQILKNVAVDEKMPNVADRIASDIAAAEAELGADGRVLVRASGTEPVVRVMVEAADAVVAEATCDRLCEAVRALGAGAAG